MKSKYRTSMIISGIAMCISLLGCILYFVQTKTFDSTGGGILAANTALYCSAYEKMKLEAGK